MSKLMDMAEDYANEKLKMWEDDESPTFDILQVRMYHEAGFRRGFNNALELAKAELERMNNLPGQGDVNQGAREIVEYLAGFLKEEA